MGRTHFHRYRQIDDDIVLFAWLQHIQHGVADLQGIFRLGACEGFRRVFKAEVAFVFCGELFDQLCALYGNLLDFFFAFFEHLLPLCHTYRIIEVNNGAGRTLAGIKGLADDVLSALGQDLNGHIFGNPVLVDQGS